MQTECSPTLFEFEPVETKNVVAGFDGGTITSDAGALLLGQLDRGLGLIRRMAGCFTDRRDPRLIEHTVETMIGQRVFGLALGYDDLNDHDELRHDPVFAVLAGKLEAKRSDCAPVAGKSTLNRLEHPPKRDAEKYHKIDYDAASLEALFVDIFLDAHARPPKEIVLDLDATDPRFATNALRSENRAALYEIMEQILKTRGRDDWLVDLHAMGLPAGEIRTVEQVLEAPEVAARNMVVEVDHPTIGPERILGSSLKLSETPVRIHTAPPTLGQHTAEILEDVLEWNAADAATYAAGLATPEKR